MFGLQRAAPTDSSLWKLEPKQTAKLGPAPRSGFSGALPTIHYRHRSWAIDDSSSGSQLPNATMTGSPSHQSPYCYQMPPNRLLLFPDRATQHRPKRIDQKLGFVLLHPAPPPARAPAAVASLLLHAGRNGSRGPDLLLLPPFLNAPSPRRRNHSVASPPGLAGTGRRNHSVASPPGLAGTDPRNHSVASPRPPARPKPLCARFDSAESPTGGESSRPSCSARPLVYLM